MKVIDIVKLSAYILGLNDLCENLESGSEIAGENAKDLDVILKCINLVQAEIASDYIQLKAETEIFSEDGKVEISGLPNKAFEILRVVNASGKNVKFEVFNSHIKTMRGNLRIVYSYLPEMLSLDDDVFFPKLTEGVFAYGVAAEYALLNSLSDEALVYERKYREGLFVATRKRGEKRVPKRRWI